MSSHRLTERVLARVAAAMLAGVICRVLLGKNIRNVKEAVLILVLLVYRAHQSGSRRQDFIDEDEDGLLGGKLDPLPNDIDKLTDRQVCRHQVLLLIDGRNVRLLDLLAYDLRTVSCCDAAREVATGSDVYVRECGRCTSDGCARPRPCASRRGARP